jgi:hypothetical protein
VVKLDQGSNAQVLVSLGALHRAIDRTVSLDDQLTDSDKGDCGGVSDSEEAQQGPGHAIEAPVAPVPAVADLLYVPDCR